MSIQTMTPGGVWLAEAGMGLPHYVVNPDHIARLQNEGYQPVADPRIPADFNEPEKGIEKDDDTNGRLAAIKPANKSSKGSVDTAQ